MLAPVTAVRFDRQMSVGKKGPCLVGCITEDGKEAEVVVKFAAGCEMKHQSLIAEALASLLAADLDLPVPEPLLVLVELDFAATIPDIPARKRAQASIGWNFGTKRLPG